LRRVKSPPLINTVTFTPIGVIHTPFADRVSAPRQAVAKSDTPGTIELNAGQNFEHALSDLEGWDYVWVIFWFHMNEGWRPKVLPPRSDGVRRGVFATRSPHRPNAIGLSLVKLESIEGRIVHVRGVDMIDGTPVLDLKPYVPYADARSDARTGWLDTNDPRPNFRVEWSARAEEQAAWLREHDVDLRVAIDEKLALGPQPNPYRRIRKTNDGMVLAVKEWRVLFSVNENEDATIAVIEIRSGYRDDQIARHDKPEITLHREFTERFKGDA
jgi:tRNA-Thr(GGU) m(6)t(6)A37 methyltransferase TsaA